MRPRYYRIGGRELKWTKVEGPGFGCAWYAKINYAEWVQLLEIEGEFVTIPVPQKPDIEGNRWPVHRTIRK